MDSDDDHDPWLANFRALLARDEAGEPKVATSLDGQDVVDDSSDLRDLLAHADAGDAEALDSEDAPDATDLELADLLALADADEPEAVVSGDPIDANQATLADLVARAETGDAEATIALRAFLVSHPEIWQRCSDLGSQLFEIWIGRIAQGNALQRESLRLKVEQLKVEHGGPNPTPLERLLVERVLVSWLQVEQISGLAAQLDGLQQQTAWFLLKRQNQAERQFRNAIETLAMVRKMAPALGP
jgi:hypothetical protein